MSGKLLVVGDSFADRYVETRPELKDVTPYNYWFDKLSHHLNMKLTNLSRSGIGNKQIFDLTFDAICDIKNIDLIIVIWSEFKRLDLEVDNPILEQNYLTYNPDWIGDECKIKWRMYSDWKKMYKQYKIHSANRGIDNFLRYTKSLSLLANEKDINIIQCFGCSPSWDNKTIKYLISCNQLHSLDENNYIGYPFFKKVGGFSIQEKLKVPDEVVSKDDLHPNQNGNDIIFKLLLEKYEKIINSRR